MRQFISDLRTRAWRTSGSRYNAARRLKQRESFSTFSLAMLSALSVAAAVAQRIYSPQPGTPLDNYMTAVSIALGVFLLAISLVEWGAAYGAKADALHRNAEDLTAYQLKLAQVLAKMDAGKALEDSEVDALRVEYETIKDRCPHNHAPSDDELFRTQQRTAPEFGAANGKPATTNWDAFVIKARWQWSTIWLFLLIWIAVTIAGAYAFWVPKT
ncbi:MAG: SLATT domain-containing protein [Proteobacteria bacterium]|nr:SLATT domain-containing protein [Pseudomonadota bacterium]